MDCVGLPPGKTFLKFSGIAGYWGTVVEVELKAGKTTNAGAINLIKYEQLEIHVFARGKLVSRSSGRAVLLEGAAPRLKIRSPAVADPFYVYGTITPERRTLSRLFAGRWMVEVKSAGFAPGFIEVRLPVTAPVKAALTAGGSAEVTLLGFDGKPARGRVFALKVGTPAHRHFVEKRALKWVGLNPSFNRMVGYFQEERSSGRNAPHRFAHLTPGVYTFASFQKGGCIAKSDVVLMEGGKRKVAVKPQLGSLRVSLKRKGRAAAGTKLILGPVYVERLPDPDDVRIVRIRFQGYAELLIPVNIKNGETAQARAITGR